MTLMELELSRIAFFCDLHRQWCALPSLAKWGQLPPAAVPVHSGWDEGAFRVRLVNISPALPLLPTSPFHAGSVESQSVSECLRIKLRALPPIPGLVFGKSLNKRCFQPDSEKSAIKSCRSRIESSPRLPLQKTWKCLPPKRGNWMHPFLSLCEENTSLSEATHRHTEDSTCCH